MGTGGQQLFAEGQLASTRLQGLSGSVQILLARLMGNTATGLSFWIKRVRPIIAEEIGSHRKEQLGEKSRRLLWHRPIYRLLRKPNSLCWTKQQQARKGRRSPRGAPESSGLSKQMPTEHLTSHPTSNSSPWAGEPRGFTLQPFQSTECVANSQQLLKMLSDFTFLKKVTVLFYASHGWTRPLLPSTKPPYRR